MPAMPAGLHAPTFPLPRGGRVVRGAAINLSRSRHAAGHASRGHVLGWSWGQAERARRAGRYTRADGAAEAHLWPWQGLARQGPAQRHRRQPFRAARPTTYMTCRQQPTAADGPDENALRQPSCACSRGSKVTCLGREGWPGAYTGGCGPRSQSSSPADRSYKGLRWTMGLG